MEWVELFYPPINLWNMPRKESMNDLWYYRAVNEIEREYEDGYLSDKEFQQAMRDLDAEYDEAIEKERDERYY